MAESSIFLVNKGSLCSPPPPQAGRGRMDTVRHPVCSATSRNQVQVLAPPHFHHPLVKPLCLSPAPRILKTGHLGSKKDFYPFNACKSPRQHCATSREDRLGAGCHAPWVLGAMAAGCISKKDRHPTSIPFSLGGEMLCFPRRGDLLLLDAIVKGADVHHGSWERLKANPWCPQS